MTTTTIPSVESEKPLVTIAIPTYNRASSYLPQCLEGALRQTYPNVEILVADNGSTDYTEELVRSYNDPRLRYFRHARNIVPNDNFNFCLREARGKYFLLLLDDEQIDVDFVEACLRAVGYRSDFGLIHSGLRVINARNVVIHEAVNHGSGSTLADLFLAWFEGRTALYLCNTLFHRETLLEAGGFASRHNLFQDVVAQVKVAARMPRVDIPDIKATTRLHSGQFTYAATVRAWCEDSLDLLELMCQLAPAESQRIRDKGIPFFALINHSRANNVREPFKRALAYAAVCRMFGYRHLPTLRMVLASTSLYRSLRNLKRRFLHQPAWAD